MLIIFAAYTPSFARMMPALAIQIAMLGALAAALVAYNRQFASMTRCLLVVLAPGVGGGLLLYCFGLAATGMDKDFAIAFFELYLFVIVAGCGMVLGGFVLAIVSWSSKEAKPSVPSVTDSMNEQEPS